MWCPDERFALITLSTLNPCAFNTVAALFIIFLATYVVINEGKVVRVVAAARTGGAPARPPPSSAVLALQACAAGVMALLHGFVLLWVTTQTMASQQMYLPFSEALLCLSWLAVLALLLYSRHAGVSARLRPLAIAAAVVYSFGLYSELQFFWHGAGISPAERQARLNLALIMEAAVLLLAGLELWLKPPAVGEDAALRQALLGGSDLEAGAADGPSSQHWSDPARRKARKHSWLSLVAIAARYMWPDSIHLQIRACVCVGLVIVLRLLNLAVPILYKRVVDVFAYTSAATHPQQGPPRHFSFHEVFSPWVLAYMIAYFFQGGAGGGAVGIISNLRSYLWIPISQSSYRRATLDVFTHVLGMDLNFHLHRKTGELMRIMDRGTSSIQTMLSTVVFSIGPAIFDIAAASVYMAINLQPWIAVIVFITLSSYIPMTIYLTEWRGQFRRELNRLDNAKGAKATDALLNYETVKYFGNEGLERRNFADAIDAYQMEDYKLSASMNYLNVAQSLVIFSGMAAGLLVCTRHR